MTLASNVQIVEFPRVSIVSTGGQGLQIPKKIIIVINHSNVLPFIDKDFFSTSTVFLFFGEVEKVYSCECEIGYR